MKRQQTKPNPTQLIQDLNKLTKRLRDIGKFTEEKQAEITKRSQEIDVRNMVNNKRVEKFIEARETKYKSPDTLHLGLDIQSENSQIHNDKFKLVQVFFEDVYERIELLGKGIIKVSQAVQSLSGELEGTVVVSGNDNSGKCGSKCK